MGGYYIAIDNDHQILMGITFFCQAEIQFIAEFALKKGIKFIYKLNFMWKHLQVTEARFLPTHQHKTDYLNPDSTKALFEFLAIRVTIIKT